MANHSGKSGGNPSENMSNCEKDSTSLRPQPAGEIDVTHMGVGENTKSVICKEICEDKRTIENRRRIDTHPFFNRSFKSAQTDPQFQKCHSKHLKPKLKSRFKAKPSLGSGTISISNYFKKESRPKLNLLGHNDHDNIDLTDLSVSNC